MLFFNEKGLFMPFFDMKFVRKKLLFTSFLKDRILTKIDEYTTVTLRDADS